jgi:integrase
LLFTVSILHVRERLIAKLALLAGMRPGEIFGLTWERMEADYADIRPGAIWIPRNRRVRCDMQHVKDPRARTAGLPIFKCAWRKNILW